MVKEEVKSNGRVDYRLVIEPKGIGNFEYTFEDEHNYDDNEIGLVRVIYKEHYEFFRSFKHIIIGEHKLNYYKILSAYGGYSGVDDFPFRAIFKTGDKFEISTDFEIKRVELYFTKPILMINRSISSYEPPKPNLKT
jgi:hypothetical protein